MDSYQDIISKMGNSGIDVFFRYLRRKIREENTARFEGCYDLFDFGTSSESY